MQTNCRGSALLTTPDGVRVFGRISEVVRCLLLESESARKGVRKLQVGEVLAKARWKLMGRGPLAAAGPAIDCRARDELPAYFVHMVTDCQTDTVKP